MMIGASTMSAHHHTRHSLLPAVIRSALIKGRQCKRDILSRIGAAANGDNYILFAVEHVSHRRSALRRWQVDCADLFSSCLVICSKHSASRMVLRRSNLWVAHDYKCFGNDQPDGSVLPRLGDAHSFQQRMI